MKQNEVYRLLCNGKLSLAFDTNAVFGFVKFWRICSKINQLNKEHSYEFNLVVSTLVHTEKLFYLKQKHKGNYDLDTINQSLSSKGVIDIQIII